MIGGADVTFFIRLPPPKALDAAVRAVRRFWKSAVFQSGTTGRLFPRYASISFSGLAEILVYRDQAAFDSWEQSGATSSNRDTMIHLLSSADGQLTAVVDDEDSPVYRGLLQAIGDTLVDRSLHMPRFVPLKRVA